MWQPKLHAEPQNALFKIVILAFGLSTIFYNDSALAATIPNLQTMITNIGTAVPNLMRLVTAISYVLGMFLIIASVMGMKHFGELRTMMAREHGMWGPIIELFIGAALLYLPTSVETIMSSLWKSPTPYAYITQSASSNAAFVTVCYTIVQLVGVIAFIRGLLILQQAGSERAQPHMLGKALSHLVGGVLCINIYGTLQMLEKTVGMIS